MDKYGTSDPQIAANMFLMEYYPEAYANQKIPVHSGVAQPGHIADYYPGSKKIVVDQNELSAETITDPKAALAGAYAHEAAHAGDYYNLAGSSPSMSHFENPQWGDQMEKNLWWMLSMGKTPKSMYRQQALPSESLSERKSGQFLP